MGGADNAGQVDPGVTASFDIPEFLVNNHGPLSTDRRSQFKANGHYETEWGLTLGASVLAQTGIPINHMGSSDYLGYPGRWELFLAPRGAGGRTPATFRLDLNLAYALPLSRGRVALLLNATNLLDNQATLNVDSRFDLTPGVANPGFRRPIAFQAPRSLRLGLRYSF